MFHSIEHKKYMLTEKEEISNQIYNCYKQHYFETVYKSTFQEDKFLRNLVRDSAWHKIAKSHIMSASCYKS